MMKRSSNEIAAFYDGFSDRLVRDYLTGNARAEAAIVHALDRISPHSTEILDIGCGIGWSSHEIATHFTEANVLGVDLSAELIKVAGQLFQSDRMRFEQVDVTEASFIEHHRYDAIVMLDVYEHIPSDKRSFFHQALNGMLRDGGRIILACPSIYHQHFLRTSRPEGLQPVDEDVTVADLARFAQDVQGDVIYFQYKHIWEQNDYFHAVIEKQVSARTAADSRSRSSARLERRQQRSRRVKRYFAETANEQPLPATAHVPDAGSAAALPIKSKPTIALLTPDRDAYSQTFIRAHQEHLQANIKHLYGGFLPTTESDTGNLIYAYPFRTGWAMAAGKLRGKPFLRHSREEALAHFFKKNNIQLVFAEFGMTGAEVLKVCKNLNLPLIVHFHGYDAFQHHILQLYGDRYKAMFSYAHAIIGVSEDMVKQLVRLGAPRERVIYNPYGPNNAFFELQPSYRAPVFAAVGRFVDKKAPYFTLAAFQEVLRKVPDSRLCMIGDGPLLNSCKNLAAHWGIDQAVDFMGARSQKEIAGVFEGARAFVQHSIVADDGDSEGTPVGILEASAAALPVVATRHAGIKDIVLHGETGLLVDEKAVNDMAAQMIRLALDPDLARTLGQNGRERIRAHFSLERHISVLQDCIEKALAGKG